MIVNVLPEMLSCFVMVCVALLLLRFNNSIALSFAWIVVCAIAYFVTLLLFPDDKGVLLSLKDKGLNAVKKKAKK
jgi:hypothetical protein